RQFFFYQLRFEFVVEVRGFMESPFSAFFRTHWDHEPRLDSSADCLVCCFGGCQPVVFGTQNACGTLPLYPCEERAGREPERGEIDKSSSPRPSPPFV